MSKSKIDPQTPNRSVDLELIVRTTELLSAYMQRNTMQLSDLPGAIRSVHSTLTSLATGQELSHGKPVPAVPIKKSMTDDTIICLEDGKPLRMLKRYLKTHHNLTPDEYRRKWGLPADYPMVAPAYARMRSSFAKDIGLGRVEGSRRRRK